VDPIHDALERALATETIAHVFQPIWRLSPPLLHGFEALSRFPNGARPDLVWALARKGGKARDLDRISVRCAIEEAFPLTGHLFVNVDGSWFGQDTRAVLNGLLADELLVYEVTEHSADAEGGMLPTGADWFREWGSFLALDDAGSGASSIDRLVSLQPRYVKLDKSLIDEWILNPRAVAIHQWVRMAKAVGANLLAEGVEDPSVVPALFALGVRYVQGFAFGRPLDAATWDREAVLTHLATVAG